MFKRKVAAEKSPEEQMREFKAALRGSVRQIERERRRLERGEEKLKDEMRRLHEGGEADTCLILAEQIVRSRKAQVGFVRLSGQLESLGLRIEILRAQMGVGDALKEAGKALGSLNARSGGSEVVQMLGEFAQQVGLAEATGECMSDVIEGIFDDGGTIEEDVQGVLASVYGEVGIPVPAQLGCGEVGGGPLRS
jgi:charged multivesicular body protein 3